MNQTPTDGLPPSFIASAEMLHAFDETLAAWNRHWFPGDALRRGRLEFADVSMAEVWEGPRGVCVHTTMERRLRLVGRALDMDVSSLNHDLDDWRVVQGFSNALFADLAERFAGLIGPEGRSGGGWAYIQFIDAADQLVAMLKAPLQGVLAARRRLAPPTRRPDAALVGLKTATGEVSVRLTASPGSAEVTLDELRRLAPGDVIVLDRGVKRPLMLQIDGAGAPVASAMMIEGAGRRSLLLQGAGQSV